MLSGDDSLQCSTWSVLSEVKDKKVFVFGSGSVDEEYIAASGWTLAPIEEANLIVARGTFTICNGQTTVSKNEDADQYWQVLEESLEVAASRRVPMLVTNPDKVRPDKGFPPMPGAIGDAYQARLDKSASGTNESIPEASSPDGLIQRIGKPFPEVYQLALSGTEGKRACMVGDALETDVTGGSQNRITTVWVTDDGIHGPAVEEGSGSEGDLQDGAKAVLESFNERDGTYANGQQLCPTIVLPHFRW